MPDQRRLLRIYLNDHLLGASGGLEVARRCLRNNRGTPLGDLLERLIPGIEQDRAELERLMVALGFRRDPVKMAAAVVGERVGRLKFNGAVRGYSPLSRLEELEGLVAGVTFKLAMWQALQRIAPTDERIAALELDRLMERAVAQQESLEEHRLEAADRAFGR